MPVVHVVSTAAKKRAIAITNVFVEMSVSKETVEVILHEVPKENWGVEESRREAQRREGPLSSSPLPFWLRSGPRSGLGSSAQAGNSIQMALQHL